MRNQSILTATVWLLFLLLWTACQDEVTPMLKSIDEQLSEEGLTRTKLGDQLKNPYSIENMKLALDTLQKLLEKANPNGRNLANEIELETTDLYVRFLPRDTTQFNEMLKDSTMIYSDQPLDYEIIQQGDVYIDSTVMDNQVSWQYAVVKPDYVFADTVDYEILAELFIPENHPDFIEEEVSETSESGRILANKSQTLMNLEMLSLSMTDNLDGETKSKMEELRSSNGRADCNFCYWHNSLLPAWTPGGTVRIKDTNFKKALPIEGAKVTVRSWFTYGVGYTDKHGKFKTRAFRHGVRYKIVWERHHFSIRKKTWFIFARRATLNGPGKKGSWNITIPSKNKDWFHATIFQAAFHYYYQDIKGLRRPPLNGFFKPQMKIKAIYEPNSKRNGRHAALARILGIFSRIKIWNNSDSSSLIYATTIHELAHSSHWNMDPFFYDLTESKVKESWARGVEWELTRMKYKNHLGRARKTNSYTLVVADMIDDPTTDNTNLGYGRFPEETQDKVSGYTIRQIEDALKGKRKWHTWRDNIKNRYNNPTKGYLNRLFEAYE